jgi:hypothetical protein
MFDHLRSQFFLKELHEGVMGKHFVANIIAKQILNAGY